MQKVFKKVIILKDYLNVNKTVGSATLFFDGNKTDIKINLLTNITSNVDFLVVGDNQKTANYTFLPQQNFTLDSNHLTFFEEFVILGIQSSKIIFSGLYPNSKNVLENIVCNINQYLEKKECFEYDDESIATQNYYEEYYGTNDLSYENVNFTKKRKDNEASGEEKEEFVFNEKNSCDVENQNRFTQIKSSLKNILNSHPKCEELNALISGGNFVKICYDKNKFYYVGSIEHNEELEYVCYGIFSNYSTPPKNANSFKFIPSSIFDMQGEGYYLLFQDAKSGKIV